MALLKIYKVEDIHEQHPLIELGEGEHKIGRDNLQCTDKRISRNHAILNVSPQNSTFKLVHANPCYISSSDDSKALSQLTKDESVVLNDNDKFGFLVDQFWYKVRIILKPEPATQKRALSEDDEVDENKKLKLEVKHDSVEIKSESIVGEEQATKTEESQHSDSNIKLEDVKSEADNNVISHVPVTESNSETNANNVKESGAEATNTDNKDNQSNPSQSQPKERRERCWYAPQCFRKNPEHKTNFSHPGDDDYASDPNDDRPTCSYGGACYRRNMSHRRQYKHPNRPAPHPKRGRKKRKVTPRTDVNRIVDSEDDYDQDDPFIDDSESDYTASSTGSDTDWEDSQNVEEDSQERKRLIKEAKRFVKQ